MQNSYASGQQALHLHRSTKLTARSGALPHIVLHKAWQFDEKVPLTLKRHGLCGPLLAYTAAPHCSESIHMSDP